MNRFSLARKSAMKARGVFTNGDKLVELKRLISITVPKTGIRLYAEKKLSLLRKAG